MSLDVSRYLTASQFAAALNKLHAYRTEFVGDRLLQELEETKLVVPCLRMRWPDPVARRFWLADHPENTLQLAIEPDGERWDAAKDLGTVCAENLNPNVAVMKSAQEGV